MSLWVAGWRSVVGLAAVVALLAGGLSVGAQGGGGASTSGPESCVPCHDLQPVGFRLDPHRVLDDDPRQAHRYEVPDSCTACHGDADEHLDAGGGQGTIFGFAADLPARTRSERCLTCHGGEHPRFLATTHAAAGLACTDCHSIHGSDAVPALLHTDPTNRRHGLVTASCTQCHAGVLAEFALDSNHPLRAGSVDCASCHDPHAPSRRRHLAGFKQETCTECHREQSGPFVFEHPAQRIDGCVACHAPHGSPNRHLLTFQRVADLCYSCHMVVPGFHSRFTADTLCTNCHTTIHGSNFDADFQR